MKPLKLEIKKYLLIVRGLIKNKSGEINMPIITNKTEHINNQLYFNN